MAYREVTGHLGSIIQGGTLEGVVVSFELLDKFGSFTSTSQYPGQLETVVTDANGDFSISLWVTEEGSVYSKYRCSFLKTYFDFELSLGDGSSISLSELRNTGTTPQPEFVPDTWQRIIISTTGQTAFILGKAPTQPQLSTLYINTVKAIYSVDYIIDGKNLTWQGEYFLAPTDYMEIYYK